MIIQIQCTAKLLKKLDCDEYNTAASPNVLSMWNANLLRINRKECVLFTHDATLYSICVPKTTKHFFYNLREIFLDNLMHNLKHENLQKYGDLMRQQYSQLLLIKSGNRSVIGTMNNMTRFIEDIVYESDGLENTNILELNSYINRIPFTPIKYQYPIECFQKFLSNYFEAI